MMLQMKWVLFFMRFNNKNYGKNDYLNKSVFVQTFEDSPINPPPPGSDIYIFDDNDNQITDAGDLFITD